MSFDRPDLQTLITRTTTDLITRFTGTYNRLRRSALYVFARVMAGLAHGLYGYLDWISNQILPTTMEESRLLRYGAMYGITRTAATYAAGQIDVTGTDGAVIPVGTLWQLADGTEYAVTAETTIAAGVAAVPVLADAVGAAGNADAGAAIGIVSPISGVNPDAVIATGGLTGGADMEDIEIFRARVLNRTARYYTGANAAIYKQWALEVAEVTRAWVYESTPVAGSVTVLFVCDDQDGGIIPDSAKIAEVEDYLEEHTDAVTGQLVGRAVNATLVVDAPIADPIDFTILPDPNTADVRAAIEAELEDMLRRDGEPGADILISHIREAISVAAGEDDYTLTAPAADVSVADGYIATMGTITWA